MQKQEQRELTEQEKKEWDKKGQFYFENQIFDEGIKCFKRSQNKEMVEQAEILNCIKKGKQKKQLYKQYLQQQQLQQFQKLTDENLKLFRNYFKLAAQRFEQRGEKLNAAKCYYSGRFYFDCIEIYLQENLFAEASKAALKAKLPLLALLINLKQENIKECLKNFKPTQLIMNLALQRGLMSQEELKLRIGNKYFLAQIMTYLEKCQKQDISAEQESVSQKQKKLKKKGKNKQQTNQPNFLNYNQQIWKKYYTKNVFDDANNSETLAALLEDELKIYQESQIQLRYSPLIATSIVIKQFDELYFEIFRDHCLIDRQFDFELIREELNQKYSKQEESEILQNFIVTFLEQGNHINLIQKITQKSKLMYLLSQNVDLKKQNQKTITLPKLDKLSSTEILSYETFAYSIITKNFEQYFPYIIENQKKELIKQDFDEIFDYLQTSIDVQINEEIYIIRQTSAFFEYFDQWNYKRKDENDQDELQYLILKIKTSIKSLQNKPGFLLECLNLTSNKEIKEFEKELEKRDFEQALEKQELQQVFQQQNFEIQPQNSSEDWKQRKIKYLQQLAWKIMNFQFRLENPKFYHLYRELIYIIDKWLNDQDCLFDHDIDILLNQGQVVKPFTFFFHFLYRFYDQPLFLDQLYSSFGKSQVFLLFKFLFEGANLYCFDSSDNQLYMASSSLFKFYIFKSSQCSFFSPQWAVIHKSSKLLPLETEKIEKLKKIKFDDEHYLMETEYIINLVRIQFQIILNNIPFVDVLFKISQRDKNYLKYDQQETIIFQEHIFWLCDRLRKENTDHFKSQNLQLFIKVCSILNSLNFNIEKTLELDSKSFWNNYIQFKYSNYATLSFYGFVKWMKFYQQIDHKIFKIYSWDLLWHELQYIFLSYLVCLQANSFKRKDLKQLRLNIQFLSDIEIRTLIEQEQEQMQQFEIQKQENENTIDNEKKQLKSQIENLQQLYYDWRLCSTYVVNKSIKNTFILLLSEDLKSVLQQKFEEAQFNEIRLDAQNDHILIKATQLVIAFFVQIISEAYRNNIQNGHIENLMDLIFVIVFNQKRFFMFTKSEDILKRIVEEEIQTQLENNLLSDYSKTFFEKLLKFYFSDSFVYVGQRINSFDYQFIIKYRIKIKEQQSNSLATQYQKVEFYYVLRKSLNQIGKCQKQATTIQLIYNQFFNLKKLMTELCFSQLLSIQQLNDILIIMKNIGGLELKLDKIMQRFNKHHKLEIEQFLKEYQDKIRVWANNQKLINNEIYSICQKYLA